MLDILFLYLLNIVFMSFRVVVYKNSKDFDLNLWHYQATVDGFINFCHFVYLQFLQRRPFSVIEFFL